MGNAGSHAHDGGPGTIHRQPAHWHNSLPSDPVLKASHLKVLPDLNQNPRLRSTNNGAILQSGGTISGKRPLSLALPYDRDPRANNGIFRSKSISQDYEAERQPRFSYLSNQRDPLHRSHTHLHIEEHEDTFAAQSKRFGSEPDLRSSQEIQPKTKISKNIRKKYRAPPPPHNNQGGSSPDSWNAHHSYDPPQPPSRKLRLFKTRAETKKNNKHNHEIKNNGYIRGAVPLTRSYEVEDIKPYPNEIFERTKYNDRDKASRHFSREEYLKYPSSREDDMVQSQLSLKREENMLQTAFNRQEQSRTKYSQQNMYREKARASEAKFEANKAFRNSERFKKQISENGVLRREKSFDNSLMQEMEKTNAVSRLHLDRQILLEDQRKFNGRAESPVEIRLKDRIEEANVVNNVKKPAPVGAIPAGITSAEFQAELMMATRKLRNINRDSPDSAIVPNNVNKKNPPKKIESKNILNGNKKLNEKPSKKETESKVNGAKSNLQNGNKTNMVTLDRSKQIKSSNAPPRIVHKQRKEDPKIVPKINGTKVLPTDKNTNENVRNRRESRVIADRGQASGKESTPEQSPSRVKTENIWDKNNQTQPNKSFYFGMDKTVVTPEEDEEMDPHEKVRRHLEMSYKNFPVMNGHHDKEKVIDKINKNDFNTRLELPPGSPESALSSEPEPDDPMSEENNPHGIALQLRPTLPKKQLEIPRFSPAAAWRLLAALETEVETNTNGNNPDDNNTLTEERIRRSSHGAMINAPRAPRSHDKSGDSGISGDAGPPNDDCIDTPTPSSPIRKEESSKRPLLSTWTPQQDLEEESSSDAGVDSPHSNNTDGAPAKFSARQQVFSLSLPRETHINQLGDKNKQLQQPFNSLQKLRKSVSGAIGVALGSKKPEADLEENSADEQADNNWFLSRSAPNSLNNNGFNTQNLKLSTAKSHDSGQHQTPPSSDQEDERLPPVMPSIMRPQPPFSYLASGGHVMYLPQYDSQRTLKPANQSNTPSPDQPYSMSYGANNLQNNDNDKLKSDGEMEEKNPDKRDKYEAYRQSLMTRSKSSGELITNRNSNSKQARPKGKRFTFQSTVRQIERRRLAEKLSREAETKEKQRLSELEAMRRVEEEFQRKRAREKASIRQQLRLVSLDESCSSLPSSWGAQGRSEPEGAVSPSPPVANGINPRRGRTSDASNSSVEGQNNPGVPNNGGARAPATRVLSEYRQDTREYKDYRRAPAAPALHPHPPACYNMPRAPHTSHRTGGWATEATSDSDNYRREFARGRRAPSSSGSDLSTQGGRLLTPPRW